MPRRLHFALLFALALACHGAAARAGQVFVARGEAVPDLRFDGLIAPHDYGNLGLARASGPFRLSEIPGEVLVLEFFNRHCVPCQRQVRLFEAFYQRVRAGELGPGLKVLGIAAGNQAKYLPQWLAKRELEYPVAADPRFDQWYQLGEPGRTPFTVFLRRRGVQWVLGGYHFGIIDDEALAADARDLLQGRAMAGVAEAASAGDRPPLPDFGGADDVAAARNLLVRVAGRPVEVEEVALPGRGRAFRAAAGARRLYAVAARRETICEICHGVHFLFAFDDEGRVLGFEALRVTKYDNREWNQEDRDFFEGRLVGRRLRDLEFDEEADAVTSATISATVIFDELRRSADLPAKLRAR